MKITNPERVEIPLSKVKIVVIMLGGVLFVVVGLWLILIADGQQEFLPTHMKMAGAFTAMFFGACVLYLVVKLFDDKPGLIVDSSGITDNSSGVAAGLITWQSIKKIEERTIRGHRYVAIQVDNPHRYIEKQSGLKRLLMSANYRYFETPIYISANSLKMDYGELSSLLNERMERYGKR
jgi:hypothetical protein